MSIDACIAHAIHSDLDILEVQQELRTVIVDRGERYLRSKDAAGLCATCMEAGVGIPPKMLLRMCQTILQLSSIDARFILDTEEGSSLFYVKMRVSVGAAA